MWICRIFIKKKNDIPFPKKNLCPLVPHNEHLYLLSLKLANLN